MNHWFGYAVLIAGNIAGIAIRIPHDSRSKKVRVADNRKGRLERALLTAMAIGVMLLPLLAISTPLLSFADYSFTLGALVAGTSCIGLYLWLLYRSHADLGTNWSATLQVRDNHSLVTSGIYRSIRHPMYAAIYFLVLAQVFLLSNWVAGPAGLVTFTLMFLMRLAPEEQMMADQFGENYLDYMRRSKRLIPGVW